MSSQPMYKVIFIMVPVYEVFARQIYQSDMWGFVEIEELVFGERSQILVDPGEESSRTSSCKRSYIPLQSIVRIDEVDKEGAGASLKAAVPKSPIPRDTTAGCPLTATTRPRCRLPGECCSQLPEPAHYSASSTLSAWLGHPEYVVRALMTYRGSCDRWFWPKTASDR